MDIFSKLLMLFGLIGAIVLFIGGAIAQIYLRRTRIQAMKILDLLDKTRFKGSNEDYEKEHKSDEQ